MAEGEVKVESASFKKQTKRPLTRREFLKIGWESAKYGALAVAGKFFWDLHKHIFADSAMLARCIAAGPDETENLYERELKDSYDKALLVVHPGFGLLRFPDRFKDKLGYQAYINDLKATIESSRQEENLVIFLVDAEDIRRGKSVRGLSFTEADLAVATSRGSSVPIACFETPDNKIIYQKIVSPVGLNDLLQQKSVKEIDIAGEFRNRCVAMAKQFAEGGGFKVNLIESATYSPSEN